jgi:branched-chain amino acid transport system substrate-binding protein
MTRSAKSVALAAATVLLASLVVACSDSGSDSSDTWRIGLEAPLSGDLSVLGDGMLKGAQMAANEINESGGLLDREVEIIPIDDAGDAKTGVDAANTAIDEGLDGVVGPYNSGVGIETLPLYVDDGLVPIRLTSDNATDGLGFTLQPMTNQIAPVAAEAMTDWLDAKTVAIAYDDTEAYTKTIAKSVRSDLEKAGAEVVAYEAIEPGADDYSSEVEKLAGTGADVVYLAVYFPEGGLMAKAMLDQGVSADCLADYGSYDTGFIETAGKKAAENCPVIGVPAPSDFPGSASLVDSYQSEFDSEPGTWSPYTYDSVNFLAEGVTAAGSFDAAAVKAELDKVDGWKGWTGSVTIDAETGNRDPATVVVVETDAEGAFTVDQEWSKAVGAPYTK